MRGKTNPNQGQSITEYAMILILVVFIIFAILLLLGPTVWNLYSQIMPGL